MSKKTNRDDVLRYLWGCLTIAANDFADGMDDLDEQTLTALMPILEKIADAQQAVERTYFATAENPDIQGRKVAPYMPVPDDLEDEIRASFAVLQSSTNAENVFEQLESELKTFLALTRQRKTLGVGVAGVAARFRQRAKRMQQLASETIGKSQIDYVSQSVLDELRDAVRHEFDQKMLSAAARLQELRDLVRARKAEIE
ncbi:hypothetical protein SH449x_002460 [Pirellulaceae bacterium SH449]